MVYHFQPVLDRGQKREYNKKGYTERSAVHIRGADSEKRD